MSQPTKRQEITFGAGFVSLILLGTSVASFAMAYLVTLQW